MNFPVNRSLLTDDERLLIKRTADLRRRAETGTPAFSGFLSPRERFIVTSHGLVTDGGFDGSDSICFFWGGYPEAERTVFCALPSFYAYNDYNSPEIPDGTVKTAGPTNTASLAELAGNELDGVIRVIRIKSGGYVTLTHRDYLGALTGLGLERDTLGDILTDESGAYVFCAAHVADFIKNELTYIGRDKVKTTFASLPDGTDFKTKYETVSGTVASARLDSVVSELAGTSRENAKELIRRGFVEHNYFTAGDCDSGVSAGDVVTVRREGKIRFGKYIVDGLDERTSKGRIRLVARKYI